VSKSIFHHNTPLIPVVDTNSEFFSYQLFHFYIGFNG
jgi:hypothetical protein